MGHRITLICDVCEKEYMLDEGMEIPPYWLGIQIAIGDGDGMVPTGARDLFLHLCSLDCFSEAANNRKVRDQMALIDKRAFFS